MADFNNNINITDNNTNNNNMDNNLPSDPSQPSSPPQDKKRKKAATPNVSPTFPNSKKTLTNSLLESNASKRNGIPSTQPCKTGVHGIHFDRLSHKSNHTLVIIGSDRERREEEVGGAFETKISMDRQGSSGLASLVSSLAETAERKASKKAAPPPMPDKSWPKVRELVKSLEKTKVPDAAEPTSPTATSPRKSTGGALKFRWTRRLHFRSFSITLFTFIATTTLTICIRIHFTVIIFSILLYTIKTLWNAAGVSIGGKRSLSVAEISRRLEEQSRSSVTPVATPTTSRSPSASPAFQNTETTADRGSFLLSPPLSPPRDDVTETRKEEEDVTTETGKDEEDESGRVSDDLGFDGDDEEDALSLESAKEESFEVVEVKDFVESHGFGEEVEKSLDTSSYGRSL
ncbi:hypothetical protein BC829DRAFT_452524 [Chytridium lagenaria]|nr:hypothetical protein BC829DRAFT_452524 [Chytridium lagenaria]